MKLLPLPQVMYKNGGGSGGGGGRGGGGGGGGGQPQPQPPAAQPKSLADQLAEAAGNAQPAEFPPMTHKADHGGLDQYQDSADLTWYQDQGFSTYGDHPHSTGAAAALIADATGGKLTAYEAQSFAKSWNNTSINTQESAALQVAVSELFGVELHSTKNTIDTFKSYDPKGFALQVDRAKLFAKGQYKVTQDYLESHGITHMTAYRGVSFYGDAQTPAAWKAVGAHRNDSGWDKAVVPQAPLSSYSLQPQTARSFAPSTSGSRGYVMGVKVDRRQIFSLGGFGAGTNGEHELVLLGHANTTVGVARNRNRPGGGHA